MGALGSFIQLAAGSRSPRSSCGAAASLEPVGTGPAAADSGTAPASARNSRRRIAVPIIANGNRMTRGTQWTALSCGGSSKPDGLPPEQKVGGSKQSDLGSQRSGRCDKQKVCSLSHWRPVRVVFAVCCRIDTLDFFLQLHT